MIIHHIVQYYGPLTCFHMLHSKKKNVIIRINDRYIRPVKLIDGSKGLCIKKRGVKIYNKHGCILSSSTGLKILC